MHLPPQELLLPGHAQGVPDQPVRRPLNVDGWLDLPDGTRVGIERAHVEEDTGKSTHVGGADGRIHGSDASLIDFNRAGVPLVEIVSRPDLRSAEQARQYVAELRAILVAIGASDAKMEEGSMRVDANVSVRRAGEPLGTRCEIKNLNSVRSLGRAIEYEAAARSTSSSPARVVRQETRHWDEGDGRTHTLRSQGGRRRLPLLPGARSRAPRPRRRVDRVGAGGDARPAGGSPQRAGDGDRGRSDERVGVGRRRARPGRYVLAVAAAGGDAARALVHVKEAFAEPGQRASRSGRPTSPP